MRSRRLRLLCHAAAVLKAAAFSTHAPSAAAIIAGAHLRLRNHGIIEAAEKPSFTNRQRAPPPSDGSEQQKKRHTLLTFGYTGTNYYGLQPQSAEGDPERPTVSDVLRAALLSEGFIAPSNYVPLQRSKWSLASRTDKGVHAACAAVSVNLETLTDDVVEQEALAAAGDPAACNYAAYAVEEAAAAAAKLQGGARKQVSTQLIPQPEWQLSAAAIARLNAALPSDVRILSGSRVRKKFDAREQASGRVYEYLLPMHALGEGVELDALDRALRTFEGTHRFHNFASGLRRSHSDEAGWLVDADGTGRIADEGERGAADAVPADGGDGSFKWPLALSTGDQTSAAFRSVVTCRVLRRVQVGGEPYAVLRIAGLSFVLHQIRHMVGSALAVTNGIVPPDVQRIALKTPLRVDVAPLVPGCGLLLDEIRWFSVKTGLFEARVPPTARTAMEEFKEQVLYPHIHSLYANGAYDDFLHELRNGSYTKQYEPLFDYDKLRKADAAWLKHMHVLAERRREERAQRRAEKEAAEAAAEASAAADEAKPDRKPFKKKPGKRVAEPLPGGLYVEICRRHQIMPGPEAQAAMELLKGKARRGELKPAQHWNYYIDALADEHVPGLPPLEASREEQEDAAAPS